MVWFVKWNCGESGVVNFRLSSVSDWWWQSSESVATGEVAPTGSVEARVGKCKAKTNCALAAQFGDHPTVERS